MPSIGWNESAPQGSDSLGAGDDEIRSLKTSVRIGLDGEHVWPSGGGDAGVHRLGSGRPFVGAQSLVSSTGTDGRLYWASDTSNFFHTGSGGTAFVGGARVISAGSYPGGVAPQRYYWAMEFGEGRIKTSGGTVITFPNSGFSGAPFTQLQASRQTSGSGDWAIAILDTVSATAMTVIAINESGAGLSNCSFFWQSIGSRVL